MRLPGSEYWDDRGRAPFPWVGVILGCVVGGWVVGLVGVAIALLAGPDGIAEVW